MSRIRLKEGDVFLVPIDEFYIVGIITRLNSLKIPFGCFYKNKFKELPKVEDLNLLSEEMIYQGKFGIQGFKNQTWKIIGGLPEFEIKKWPLPVFYNKSYCLPGELIFLDDKLEEYKRERAPLSEENYKNFPDTGLGGSGYIEKKIAKLLSNT